MAARRPGVFALALAVCLTVGAGPLFAQTSFATLKGSITDEQKAVLPGATVTIRHLDTNTTRTAVTDQLGQYFVPNLPTGTYEVVVTMSGFGDVKREIALRVGQEAVLDLTMGIATLEQAVTVSGQAALVETRTTVGGLITNKQIDELPTIARDFSDLAKLAPGITSTGQSGMGFSTAGQKQYQNNVFVDGATNAMQFYGTQAESYPQDWIQEFQVMTNGFSAEFGQASGGVLNVITRSGSNRVQGRVYGFFRDDRFDTAPYAGRFVSGEPQYLDSPPEYGQQRWGGFLGGPIVKDKTFFFAGAENLDNEATTVLALSNYWRDQGYETVLPSENTNRVYMVKADWNASQKNRFSFRHSRTAKTDKNCSGQGGDGCNSSPLWSEEKRATFDGPLWSVLGNWTSTLSSRAFNELRAYYGVNKLFITCNLAGTYGLDLLQKNASTGQYTERSHPGGAFGCSTTGGLEGETNLYFNDTFMWVLGRHQVKFGGQLARVNFLMDIDASQKGRWSFPSDRVFNINDPASYPDQFNAAIGTATHSEARWNQSLFIQDTWQARPNLTLNFGLRYDIDNTILVGNDLVDARNQRYVQNLGVTPPLNKVKRDVNNVAPRAGFVWLPTADRLWSIRGSVGVFYDQNHFNYNDVYTNQTLLAERRVSFNANSSTANPFWPDRNAMRAFLARNFPLFPDLSSLGIIPELVVALAPDFRIPYTIQATVGFSRQIGPRMSVQADYVHARGDDSVIARDQNVVLVNGQFVGADPRYTGLNIIENGGWTRYNGLQTRAEFRTTPARIGMSYTLAKATSNTLATQVSGTAATNPLDLTIDEGPTNEDRRHVLAVDGSYLLPLDFQVSGLWRYYSPLPYSVSSRFVVFARPEPRNSRRGDDEYNMDLRVGKNFKLGGRASAGVFWEMFNVFNTDNFQAFQGSLESTSFGVPARALAKRRQQFGFRFDF
ncbi:MAG TPA: carboxypeptidase regulatory-like domain-containing protein [Vicinamibacterales bacterium]|nr:carboxypeptidase regulatory-like domain-containing protein [Vicinamibacterales bacterium]